MYEFRWGGALKERPAADAPDAAWLRYSYAQTNTPGEHTEWWYHRLGCRQWLLAVRNTSTNEVLQAFLPNDQPET